MAARRSAPPLSGAQLLLRFSIAGFLALSVVAVVSAVVSRRVGRDEATEQARQTTYLIAKGIVEPAVTDDVVAMTPAGIRAMDDLMRRSVLQNAIVRVKIWKADGTVVYSDLRNLIGEQFTFNDDERELLERPGSRAEISDLSALENQFERPIDSKLLESYSTITGPHGEPMLFEGYFQYDAVVDTGRRAWTRFAPVSLGSLALLELLQFPIFIGLSRRLKRNQQERERLLANAIDASDAERRRIARDLHDGVVQDLTGVSYTLTAATLAHDASGPAPIDPQLAAGAAMQIRESVKSLRSLLVEIYPPNLHEEGLEPALSDLLTRCSNRGLATSLDIRLPPDGLTPASLTLLYRGAQEALRNVLKHSQASSVSVSVLGDAEVVRLVVDDDGKGIDGESITSQTDEGHVGLKVLGDVVAEQGGRLSLVARAAGGTSFRMEVPR